MGDNISSQNLTGLTNELWQGIFAFIELMALKVCKAKKELNI